MDFSLITNTVYALGFAIGIRVLIAFLCCSVIFVLLGQTKLSLPARKLIFTALMAFSALVAVYYGLQSGNEVRKQLNAEYLAKEEAKSQEKKAKRDAERKARELQRQAGKK